ncbi:serine/arginine repetitive matrix protein 1-like [Hypanus sabinus]|uniref:serine/arginine repetitive matrix protein 1-like n=1 Tax=Hypanus sabinus TaxID=79690 RepID=UPI0028C42256|nr:serine/arginine repetitive matrix protein 1-like [Hypanus sabinus]
MLTTPSLFCFLPGCLSPTLPGSSLKYTGSEDDLLSNMETLSLLGSVSTLASSVLELEAETVETPSPGDLAEPAGQSGEKELQDPNQYEEPEFCGIGSIDLEMEQIFAGMEYLQKKVPEDLHAIVEETPILCRPRAVPDGPPGAFGDTEVKHSPLVDASCAKQTEESGPGTFESSEDTELHKGKRIPSLQNLLDLGGTDQEDHSSQVLEGEGTCASDGDGNRGAGGNVQSLYPSTNDNGSDEREDCAASTQGSGRQVMVNLEDGAAEKMLPPESAPSSSPADAPENKVSERASSRVEDDRLLIEKIKNYYEAAETSSDQHLIQRRESISFIPTGVVRDSVLRFNYKVAHERIEELHDDKAGARDSPLQPGDSGPNQGMEQPQGSGETCLPLASRQEGGQDPHPGPAPVNGHGNSADGESEPEFRSCAEIIMVWREMERAARFWGHCPQGSRAARASPRPSEASPGEPLLILEDSDLESRADTHSDPPSSPGEEQQPRSTEDPGPCCFGEGADRCLLQNSEKIMTKVQLLAKMYSQRISRKKALLQRRVWELDPEARPGHKLRRRKPAPDLSRAQECQQEHKYDSIRSLEPPAAFGHLIIREPVPVLFAQENSVRPAALRVCPSVSSPWKHPSDSPADPASGRTSPQSPVPSGSPQPIEGAHSPGICTERLPEFPATHPNLSDAMAPQHPDARSEAPAAAVASTQPRAPLPMSPPAPRLASPCAGEGRLGGPGPTEGPAPRPCAASELCCPLPSWVSLRGRSPSPSAVKQLEQWMWQPRFTHTTQPCPSAGMQARTPSPSRPWESRDPEGDPRIRPSPGAEPPPCVSLRLRSPSPFRSPNRAEPPQPSACQRPVSLQLCPSPLGKSEPAPVGFRPHSRRGRARPESGAARPSLTGSSSGARLCRPSESGVGGNPSPGGSPVRCPQVSPFHPNSDPDGTRIAPGPGNHSPGLRPPGTPAGLRSSASAPASPCPSATSPRSGRRATETADSEAVAPLPLPGLCLAPSAPASPSSPPPEELEPAGRSGSGTPEPGEAEKARRLASGGRTSYSTTLSLQIGGGGRPATISRAQVSLTQTFLPAAAARSPRRITGASGSNPPST